MVKSSTNGFSLHLLLFIETYLYKKWIKSVTPNVYATMAVGSPCVVPFLDLTSLFSKIKDRVEIGSSLIQMLII